MRPKKNFLSKIGRFYLIPFSLKQFLSEYTAASSGFAGERIDGVRAMLADMLRRDEESEKLKSTEEALKQLLAQLESDKPARELQLASLKN